MGILIALFEKKVLLFDVFHDTWIVGSLGATPAAHLVFVILLCRQYLLISRICRERLRMPCHPCVRPAQCLYCVLLQMLCPLPSSVSRLILMKFSWPLAWLPSLGRGCRLPFRELMCRLRLWVVKLCMQFSPPDSRFGFAAAGVAPPLRAVRRFFLLMFRRVFSQRHLAPSSTVVAALSVPSTTLGILLRAAA